MRGRDLVAAAVVGAGLVVATALPAHAGRETAGPYVAGTDPVVHATGVFVGGVDSSDARCPADPAVPGVGGTCLAVEPGERTARVRIVDASGLPVSGHAVFLDVAGQAVGHRSERFCQRAELPVPEGAVRVSVAVDASVIGCGVGGGVATAGTVVAYFT